METANSNKLTSAAMEYAALGWPVVLAAGKNPGKFFGSDWGAKATTDEATLCELLGRYPDANLGVVCGPRSGIVDVGINKPGGQEVLSRIFDGDPTPTTAFQSTRGKHFWFQWREGLPPKARYFIGDGALEIIPGNNLAQVIVPPSECDGVRRDWLPGCAPSECPLAEIPDNVLARMVAWDGATLETVRGNGTRRVAEEPGSNGQPVAEGQRNDWLTKLAGTLRRPGLEPDVILPTLRAANAKHCRPPLPDSEVEAIANSVGRYAVGADARPAVIRPVKFQAFTCAELMQAKFEVRYLVDKILVEGQPCILAGQKKCLKTTLLIDLALSLAMGGYFLGKWPVPEAVRTGLMTGESGLATVQETIRRVARSAGWDPAGILSLVVTDRVPLFDNVEHEAGLVEFIEDNELAVLIVDPTYMAMGDADHGNLFDMGVKLRRVTELCQERGVTLVLAHHTRKGGKADKFGPPELEDIAWAGFQEFARQWLLLNRRDYYKPGTGQHKLWFAAGGSAGHGCLKWLDIEEGDPFADGGRFWEVAVLEPENEEDKQARKEEKQKADYRQRLDRDKATICKAGAKFPGGEVKSTIQAASGLHSSRFGPAFAELVTERDLVPCELVRRNRKKPYAGYRLGGTE